MKISNKKIIVSTLALAMGAALAGSISGSVAWYQYSTRAAAQFKGTSIGTTGNLQVKMEYGTHVSGYSTYVDNSAAPDQFKPMSASGTTAGSLTYYRAPVARQAQLPEYGSTEQKDYVEYTLSFQFLEDGSPIQKNVYLTYFAIENAGSANDISSAVRVEIIGTNKFFLSKVAADDTSTTTVNELQTITHGELDLDPEGLPGYNKPDTLFWKLDDSDYDSTANPTNAIDYINGSSQSYTTQAHSAALNTSTDPYDLDTDNEAKVLTTTTNTSTAASIKVRIWLEGWDLLGGTSARWAETYMNQNFNVNMQFACSATK